MAEEAYGGLGGGDAAGHGAMNEYDEGLEGEEADGAAGHFDDEEKV